MPAASEQKRSQQISPLGRVYEPKASPGLARTLNHQAEKHLEHISIPKSDAVIVDVGANIGVFAIKCSKKIESGRIICIEPINETFAVLQRNLRAIKHVAVTANEVGAGNVEKSDASFRVVKGTPELSEEEDDDEEGAASALETAQTIKREYRSLPKEIRANLPPKLMVRMMTTNMIKRAIEKRRRARGQAELVTCKMSRLSSILRLEKISKIDLVKINIPKGEHNVIDGIDEMDFAKVNAIVVVVHNEERLESMKRKLHSEGLTDQIVNKSAVLDSSSLFSLYATRQGSPS